MMDFLQLTNNIQDTHDYFQQKAVSAVNQGLTVRNWIVGFYIVEFELNGKDRGQYGKNLLSKLAKNINIKGLSYRTFRLCRQFYLTYPQIWQTVSAKFKLNILLLNNLKINKDKEHDLMLSSEKIIKNLSFSHLVELMKIDDPLKRLFYEIQTINACWALRELKRQVSSLLYERTGLSANKQKVLVLLTTTLVR